MDLYAQASEFPTQLWGRRSTQSYQELRRAGTTKGAISWRAGQGRLQRPFRGAYLLGDPGSDLLDTIHAALLVCPPHAVLGFQTAAQLLGFGVIPSREVHVVVPAGTSFPQRRGIRIHQVTVPTGEPVEILGVPCTPAARCAVDLARTVRRLDALPVLDAALHSRACTLDDLLAEVPLHDGLRGIRQVRDLAPIADPRPQCRQESQLRLVLHDGNVKGFEPQTPVADDAGDVRHIIDLADPASMVGAEYDGSSHLDRLRMRDDRTRHNWLESRGWLMRYFTDRDLYHRPEGIVFTINSARFSPRSRTNPRG